jgi:hypothetical protein
MRLLQRQHALEKKKKRKKSNMDGAGSGMK